MGIIARLSARFGPATRAVMVLGGGVLTFASFAASAVLWSLWLVLWVVGVGLGAARLGRRIGRWMWPTSRAHLAPACLEELGYRRDTGGALTSPPVLTGGR